jgi:hypothetical protein
VVAVGVIANSCRCTELQELFSLASMRTRWKTALLTTAAGALAFAAALPAAGAAQASPAVLAASSVAGPYTVTPSTGNAQAFHFTATVDTGNWNYRAVVQCSDAIVLVGGWHTFGSGQSNTANCSSGGHGHAVDAQFDYRQSAPIRVGCWFNGQSRSGTCSS